MKMLNQICDDCINRFSCIFDANTIKTSCELYVSNDSLYKKFVDLIKKNQSESNKPIRCKDCKYWRKLVLNEDGDGMCHADNSVTISNQDWFCADGKRKET